ncbi:MAG TPA: class I SAM-dependent methyltransferase [Thermoanaerobaculia bacterium]|nr:class I SAM-dependent methyltransferase [Thermoanaerobaculia bacterium]HPA52534.1 class I SAM-dependent methyltransferase [Thermoanaerobaculia bacterium]HQN06723.1 class I SAM-dependent methyltransferase [Thermoanaerobaculia bacterium]HQP86379.1 class I SAM-dependent methyltransferase [Thermoanaerobaculia bacterium]
MTGPSTPRIPGPHEVFRAASALPLGARLHLAVRRWSAPWERVVDALDGEAALLDVGCGPGLLAFLLESWGAPRPYVGLDPDARKISRARAWLGESDRRTFRACGLSEAGAATFGAASIVDVLYLVPRAERAGFVAAVAARLAPGGRLVVLTSGGGPRWKRRLDRVQERLAVALLGWTRGAAVEPCDGSEVAALLVAADLAEVRVEDAGAGYLHGFELVSGRKRE